MLAHLQKKLASAHEALFSAARLNLEMLRAKLAGRKTLVVQVSSASQLMHIDAVLKNLLERPASKHCSIWILTKAAEASKIRTLVALWPGQVGIGMERASRLLISCDFMLAVDQGALFPYFGCPIRACSFHGQPSKGNTYQFFNYRQINTLFVYGPMMRDYYLRTKANHPEWPKVMLLEVGQPLADQHFSFQVNPRSAREQLNLNPERQTILYAPSFEYCSSIATSGREIIDSLLAEDINLIVKPHPAFYNTATFDDDFNRDIPHQASWHEAIVRWTGTGRCVFPSENTLNTEIALAAADVMLTDYSGIAFDGIALDLGMIYWDCPQLYDEYLPRRYGVTGDTVKTDLACNVGRDCGIVVQNITELLAAVAAYKTDPDRLANARRQIRHQLYFNQGCATGAMTDAIERLIIGTKHDQ